MNFDLRQKHQTKRKAFYFLFKPLVKVKTIAYSCIYITESIENYKKEIVLYKRQRNLIRFNIKHNVYGMCGKFITHLKHCGKDDTEID